jgi:hypothetical protein
VLVVAGGIGPRRLRVDVERRGVVEVDVERRGRREALSASGAGTSTAGVPAVTIA